MSYQFATGLLYTLMLLSLGACNRSFYSPNEAYLHGLDQKGSIRIGGSLPNPNPNAEYREFSGLAAYSPVRGLGLVGSYQRVGSNQLEEGTLAWRIQLLEGAVGYYYKRSLRSHPNQSFLLDVYGGYGAGSTRFSYEDLGRLDISFDRLFLSSGVHFWLGRKFGVSFGLRLTQLNFKKATVGGLVGNAEIETLLVIEEENPFFTVEPSVQYTFGSPSFRVYLSMTGFSSKNVDRLENSFVAITPIGQPLAKVGFIISPNHFGEARRKKQAEEALGFGN